MRQAIALLILAPTTLAQTTTIITHGFTLTSKGAWVEGMADEILTRAGAGRIYRYKFDEHAFRWNPVPNPPTIPDDPDNIVLIFNWIEEAGIIVDGENWNFAQAAADALVAAMRDAEYLANPGPTDLATDRTLHFIGHSRGAVVNSEAIRRLAIAGIPVDQATYLDPHPVNATLDDCNPFGNFDWNDPVPAKWSNTAFADNYWRHDNNICDFDGMPLPLVSQAELDESALVQGGYDFEHLDVHLWYHATIDFVGDACDGEECMTADLRELWFTPPQPNPLYDDQFGGYYFSALGGGAADRPDQPRGMDPGTLPVIVNGDFDNDSIAGWRYHAGTATSSDLDSIGGNAYLSLDASNPDSAHNRCLIPARATDVTCTLRVFAPSADDQLTFDLIDDDDTILTTSALPLNTPTGTFDPVSIPLPPFQPDAAYRLRARVDPGPDQLVQASIGIDDIDIVVSACPADVNADGILNILDFIAFQNAFIAADPAADCNADNALNILDFICFQALFTQGCD